MSSGSGERNPRWTQPDGAPISCFEKLKVLNENYEELRQLVDELVSNYRERST